MSLRRRSGGQPGHLRGAESGTFGHAQQSCTRPSATTRRETERRRPHRGAGSRGLGRPVRCISYTNGWAHRIGSTRKRRRCPGTDHICETVSGPKRSVLDRQATNEAVTYYRLATACLSFLEKLCRLQGEEKGSTRCTACFYENDLMHAPVGVSDGKVARPSRSGERDVAFL